jgi:hypothetical protein
MPYREKTAWLSLLAMAVTFGPYFVMIGTRFLPSEPMPNLRLLGFFAVTAIGQMLILGVGHLYLRLRSTQEARMPLDERDQAIMRRSISSAYYVLIAGMILVGCVMPFNSNGWSIINAALFMIVAAEVVHYGIIVFSYRRQA